MDSMDWNAFEQFILKLGLVNPAQLAEVHDEIGAAPELQHLIAALERKAYLTPWQRGKVLKGDPDGYILGGYKLLYKIQSGSFGRVYRAVDARDGRVVAVKVLRRRWSENEQRIEMFIREGKVGLMLKHPNIVEVLAINRDTSSGQYYIVMEFVEGGNLREILQIQPAKKMSVPQSLRIAEDCSNGLAYAYSRGMTHRDIKLTNILISDVGEAKLVDFGLAQFFSTAARTEDEKVDRTVDYAGLERGTDVKSGDIRSDIYFLGTVLYECLTGRSPLSMTKDKHARMRKGRFEEVRPIHPSEIEGAPSVLMLVETMMALDPKDRYQTPSQLVDAIRRVRREVEGRTSTDDDRPPTRTVFLAEPDDHLQDILRDGLKDQGYKVFLAGDPLRALDRFHKQPFDGLIVDARTTGEEGFRVFEHIIDEAARRKLRCAAMLLLDEEQGHRAALVPTGPHICIMKESESDPITFKNMSRKLKELMAAAHDSKDLPALVRPAPLAPPPPPPPPPKPASRVMEAPRREEIAPPPPRPRREETPPPPPRREPVRPTAPAASASPPPAPRKAAPPPSFMSFSVMTDDSLPSSEDEDLAPPPSRSASVTPPPYSEPTVPAARSAAPPREEAAPAPRHEPMAASTPAAYSGPTQDDLPMLALEEGIVLPPPEESLPLPPRQEATPIPPPSDDEIPAPQLSDDEIPTPPSSEDTPTTTSDEEIPAPRRKEEIPPPPPLRKAAAPTAPPRKPAGSPPRRQEAAVPPPSRQEGAPPVRRAEPRRKRELEPVMQHISHEDQLAAPDTHHWREELGVPDKKVEKEKFWIRLQKFWEALTPTQKSITGLVALGLVVGLFFTYMIGNMLTRSKFDKIQDGMSIQQVEKIMGGPGEKIEFNKGGRKGIAQNTVQPEGRRWEIGDQIIVVTFSNGKVVEGGKQIQDK